MSLKLVADNVEQLPVYNPKLIPDIARTFADKVEAGEFGRVDRVVTIVETEDGLAKLYWGDELTHLEAVGIFHLALTDATIIALGSYGDEIED